MRKKLTHHLKVAAAVLCTFAVLVVSVPLQAGASAVTTATTTDYLNLRQGPGTDTRVILTLIKNATVTVIDNSDSQWARVRTASGYVGYCSKQYLNISGDQGGSSSSSSSTGTAKTTTGLNMRNGPSLGYGIITVLSTGTTLTVLDNSNSDWVRVQTSSGRQGWCSRQYLTVSADSSSGGSGSGSSSGLTATMTDYLNLRTGAGLGYRILLTMQKGSTATVLDNSNSDWVRVRTSGGTEGWCSREYVKISGSSQSSSSSGQTPAPAPTPAPTPAPAPTPSLTGATVTADLLRLRSGPGTSYSIVGNLPNGTYLKSLSAPQDDWMKVQTPGGQTGYVFTTYVKYLYDGNTGSSSSGGSISIAVSSAQIPQGKTLWLKPSGSATWASSNPSVATVSNGYVLAVAPGTAQITGGSATCSVTVTEAEPVRVTYASPNIAAPGSSVTFTAVTDTSRDGVRFLVKMTDGSVATLDASLAKTETTNGVTTKVWTASKTLNAAGVYSYTAVSSLQGTYSSGGATSDVMVATQGQATVSTSEARRASDSILNLIANWEGYSAGVYADQLTYSQIPTIGYGYTLGSGAIFYNNLSKTEAWAMLVNAVNCSSYTTELNRMVVNNNFLMNQNQADALISFAYNIGSGYFNCSTESGFRRIMKNAVVPPTIPGSGLGAETTDDVSLRSDHTVNSNAVCGVSSGTAVTVTGVWDTDKHNVWYSVRLSNGQTGWMNSGYVNFNASAGMTHDLNYTNAVAFGSELILWNRAGGNFIPGLFYRRLSEANVYTNGDFKTDHSYLLSNPYGYTFPKSASVCTG